MIRDLFIYLNRYELEYVLLHSNNKLECNSSDIDILIKSCTQEEILAYIKKYLDLQQGFILSSYETVAGNVIINMLLREDSTFKSYRLDFYFKPYLTVYKTYPYAFYFLNKEYYFKNILIQDNIKMPDYNTQFIHYLLRKILKKDLNKTIFVNLINLYLLSDKNTVNLILKDIFPIDIIEIIKKKDENLLCGKYHDILINELMNKKFYKKISFFRRIQTVYKKPRGLHIAIIGPDGTGKTTLIEELKNKLEPIFNKVYYQHLRPTLIPATRAIRKDTTIPKPHSSKEYNQFISKIKFFILIIDYIFGYYSKIFPKLIKGNNLFISDRYFYDLLVDPRRFRLIKVKNVGVFIIKFFLPKPDITILLYASPDIVFKRKQDLEIKEILRQNQEFIKMKTIFSEVQKVSSEQAPERVIDSVIHIIKEFYEKK